VRGTTRDPQKRAEIEAAGAEAFVGDPDRVATLVPAFDHASVACILLGSASGDAAQLAALHGTRLEMMLQRMLDTTIRGIAYEASGTVDQAVLEAGAELVRTACRTSRIPCAVFEADPGAPGWTEAASRTVESLLIE
jgi:hypothetical protein